MDLYHRSPPIKKKWYLIIAIMLQCSNWTAQWKKCKDYKWFWPVLGERYSFWVRLQKAIQSNPWQYNSSKNEGILQYIVSFFQHFVIHLKKRTKGRSVLVIKIRNCKLPIFIPPITANSDIDQNIQSTATNNDRKCMMK